MIQFVTSLLARIAEFTTEVIRFLCDSFGPLLGFIIFAGLLGTMRLISRKK